MYLSQLRNLDTYFGNIFFAVTYIKMSHRSIGGKFIFIPFFTGKFDDHHFEKIIFQIFENLQAITILKFDYGFMPIHGRSEAEKNYTFFQGL